MPDFYRLISNILKFMKSNKLYLKSKYSSLFFKVKVILSRMHNKSIKKHYNNCNTIKVLLKNKKENHKVSKNKNKSYRSRPSV